MSRCSLNKRLLIHKIRWHHNLRLLELGSSLTVAGAVVRGRNGLRLRLIFLVLSLFFLLLERFFVVNSSGSNTNHSKSACEFVLSYEASGTSEVTSAMRRGTSSVSASIEAPVFIASPSLSVSVFLRVPPRVRTLSELRS